MNKPTEEGFERSIEAVRQTVADGAPLRTLVRLDLESAETVARSLVGPARCVYVVRTADAELLLSFGAVFEDCGRKHPNIELARTMLGRRRVPVSHTEYGSAGRLSQGIDALLVAATARSDFGPYIISVPSPVFDAVHKEVEAARGEEAQSPRALSPYEQLLAQLPNEVVPTKLRTERFIGESAAAELVRRRILQVADKKTLVLILGPSGAGKEVVARAIHDFGPHPTLPFEDLNCGAVPASLFESELFGYLRGAFTGAFQDTIGIWEAAGGGTLFLDEIGELSLEMQAKLLRALDQNAVRPLRSTSTRHVEARVLAATNRNLDAMVRAGQFREDLYYRLRDEVLYVPPLRDHPEDIPRLAQFFWRRIAGSDGEKGSARSPVGKSSATTAPEARKAVLGPGVLARLMDYRWPGNVRELKSVLGRLHGLFEEPSPTVAQLNTVFALEGQLATLGAGIIADGPASAGGAAESEAAARHRGECLQHLRRTDEVMRACEVMLAPLLRKQSIAREEVERAHDVLHLRLLELEELCMHPLLFGTDVTFRATHRLKRRLQEIHSSIEGDIDQARTLWTNDAVSELALARDAIFAEVKGLVEA